MGKLRVIDYLNEVDYNKKLLVEHCNKNGVVVSDASSLSSVVQSVQKINVQNNKYKVEWIEIDGTVLHTDWVNHGDAVQEPDVIPNYDPEYIEFDGWHADRDLNNITGDTYVLPHYQPKADANGDRWSIIKADFNGQTSKTVTLYLKSPSVDQTFTVDWGDGSEFEEFKRNTNISHTYTVNKTIIRIKSSASWSFSQSTISGGSFMIAAYLDANCGGTVGSNVGFYRQYQLKVITFPKNSNGDVQESTLSIAYTAIKAIVLPDSFKYCVYTYGNGTYALKLKYIVLPKSLKAFSGNSLAGSLFEHIVIPENVTTIYYSDFARCVNLKYFEFPSGAYASTVGLISCYSIKKIKIGEGISKIYPEAFMQDFSLEEVNFPSSLVNIGSNCFESCYALKNLILSNNFNYSLNLKYSYQLTKECIIDICLKLKDNTGLNTKTITFSESLRHYLYDIKVDNDTGALLNNDEGVSLLEYVQNKNWTVSFDKYG